LHLPRATPSGASLTRKRVYVGLGDLVGTPGFEPSRGVGTCRSLPHNCLILVTGRLRDSGPAVAADVRPASAAAEVDQNGRALHAIELDVGSDGSPCRGVIGRYRTGRRCQSRDLPDRARRRAGVGGRDEERGTIRRRSSPGDSPSDAPRPERQPQEKGNLCDQNERERNVEPGRSARCWTLRESGAVTGVAEARDAKPSPTPSTKTDEERIESAIPKKSSGTNPELRNDSPGDVQTLPRSERE
jgi:hypothetical protein